MQNLIQWMRSITGLIVLCCLSSGAQGKDPAYLMYNLGTGPTVLNGDLGGDFSMGTGILLRDWPIYLYVNALHLTWTRKENTNERYYWDSFSNGQKRCRDRTNGQFSKNENCDDGSKTHYGFEPELLLWDTMMNENGWGLYYGPGFRVGTENSVFFSAGANWTRNPLAGFMMGMKLGFGYWSMNLTIHAPLKIFTHNDNDI